MQELRLSSEAVPEAPARLRRALSAFLSALAFSKETIEDVVLAVGEALANAAEHAYSENHGNVDLYARVRESSLLVEVSDSGTFQNRERTDGRGFGLTIVRAIARDVKIDTGTGTRISMVFELGSAHGSQPQALHGT